MTSFGGTPELPVEKAAEIQIFPEKDEVPLDLLLISYMAQQDLSRMDIYNLSLLYKTVEVIPEVMRMLGGLSEGEVTIEGPELTAAMSSLTVN